MKLNPKAFNAYNETRPKEARKYSCHAPFSSLNFEQGGNITACCYNRTHVLGKYPEDSLKDIWVGKKAIELREFIKNNDFGHGCELCAQQINNYNFEGSRAKGFDIHAQNNSQISYLEKLRSTLFKKIAPPKVFEFELDNICNLECVMCSGKYSSLIRKNREKLPPLKSPYDENFVKQLKPFIPYLKEAKFLGGEPFLNPIYYKIWDLMMEINPNIEIYITTNATILTKKVKEVLERLNVNLVISIDAISKDLYEKIRINANYEKVKENIEYFFEFGRKSGKDVSFTVCPMTNNWHEIPKLVDYCNENNKNIYFNTVVYPEDLSLRSMYYEDLKKVINYFESYPFVHTGLYFQKNIRAFKDLTNYFSGIFNDNHLFVLEKYKKIESIISQLFDNSELELVGKFYLKLQKNLMGNGELREKEFDKVVVFDELKNIISTLGENNAVKSVLEIIKHYCTKNLTEINSAHIEKVFSKFKSFSQHEVKDIPDLLYNLMSKDVENVALSINKTELDGLEKKLKMEYIDKLSYDVG